ncbi:MAG TPA: PadR family transcriptional regulator [Candidatus Saccharimonadales bacterium]|nr:PadR family transcriptional regulator [Candidatus Saccharimonadales bacterium]
MTAQTPKEYADQVSTQMRKGFLVYCVLMICSKGEMYSSDIIQELRDTSFVVVEGTMYPLLNRLQKDGLLLHDWKESPSGPPRKYYRISPGGHDVLHELKHMTQQFQIVMTNLEKE